ncbi:MAG: cation:proton antiporter regulatory subunit [Actinomycetia bacterium]|nr:cation:proton antiporter regulatory subunit [Actinomycetes bacterium]
MDVNETMLPGVGMRYEFNTVKGERFGMIAYRDGRMDLVSYSDDDPDECISMVRLDRTEVETVAEIMGAPRITARIADLTREIPGLVSAQIEVPPNSPYIGEELGETRCRTRTGASIVAMVRGTKVVSSPTPQERLAVGDVLVVIGTETGIDEVRKLISGG